MKSIITYISFLLFINSFAAYSQTFLTGDYTVILENNLMKAINSEGETIFEKSFNFSNGYTADLDFDGKSELMINDITIKNDSTFYFTLYIYTGDDSFILVDSIYSGVVEPYLYSSEDVEYTFIVTGNTQFEQVNNPDCLEAYLPLYCWMYNGNKLVFVNDEVYDVFMIEIDRLLTLIDLNYYAHSKTCEGTKLIQGLLAAIYANYIYAYELSNAEIFLKKYYHCDDIQTFKELITGLF